MLTPAETDISSTGSKSTRRRWIIPAGLVFLAILITIGVLPRLERRREAEFVANASEVSIPVVSAVRATQAPPTSELLLPGNTEAINVAAVYARANGYVRQRFVEIGAKVKAGQVLAVIESPEVDQELEQARASLVQCRAALQQAKANVEQARAGVRQAAANLQQARANEEISSTTNQRWERLVNKGVLPRQAGDERRSDFAAKQAATGAAEAAVGTAEATVNSQEANVAAAQAVIDAQAANVRRLERLQGFERVVAPFDGVITERKVERGDLVTAGSGSDKNLFSIAQASTLRIRINVPQAFAVDLKPGQAAELFVRERAGQKFSGTVARTANSLDAASRTLLTEVQIDNKDGQLLPGMYAQVKFHVAGTRGVAIIPSDALIVDSRGPRVALITPENKIHFAAVRVGRDLGKEQEILEGLKGGELLVSNPGDLLAEGQPVRAGAQPGSKEGKP
jgi:RND family efflux transporter MFP subunit